MDPLKPFEAARQLIDAHGREAKSHAMQRVLDARQSGDDGGEMAWMGVFDAVLELEAGRPGGRPVH